MMIEPVSDTELVLRRAIVEKVSTAALDCSWDCPDDCRTHHPSISVSGWAPADEPEDIDGTIEAIAHVAALAVQPKLAESRATTLGEAELALTQLLDGMQATNPRRQGIAFAVGVLQGIRLHGTPDAPPLVDDGQPMTGAELEAVEHQLGAGQ